VEHTGFHIAEDGTRIWYGATGEGLPVVLCDGLACDGFIWPYLIDAYVDDYRVLRWHYPAHGQSDIPADLSTLSVERFARDLRGMLEDIGERDVVLAGHSLGVQVIFEFYEQFPEVVRGIVAICGNYKKPLDTFHNTDTLRRSLPYLKTLVDTAPATSQAVWRRLVDSTFSKLVATLAETNPALMRSRDIDPYLEHVADMDIAAFVQMLENVADHSAEETLPDIEVPTLVIAGENDTFTPMYRSEEMAEMIPESRLVVVPNGTHASPLEAPGLINDSVRAFLRDI
jgi:pimeloyl-ACP methyl ester carboxylesterase